MSKLMEECLNIIGTALLSDWISYKGLDEDMAGALIMLQLLISVISNSLNENNKRTDRPEIR
jgi:hypothetical protein